jgi:2-(3-amino-3-carboxypropyl)histidine synthase
LKILLQFPEGLKRLALEYAQKYEAQGHEVFVSASSCYGGCDIALEEAKAIGAKKIVHFGHSKFIRKKLPIEIEYVEWHEDIELKNFENSLTQLAPFKKIALATTVQHVHQLDEMKKFFEQNGKKVFTSKGALAFYEGQILGCDVGAVKNIENKIDAVVFIGDGFFHPLAIDINKPVFVINPKSGEIKKINEEIEKLQKKRHGLIAAAVDAKNFGILVSTKPGQFNVAIAKKIKKELERREKNAVILISNEFNQIALNNFLNFDCYITTACPRIVDDYNMYGKPILDIKMFNELLKIIDEMKRH